MQSRHKPQLKDNILNAVISQKSHTICTLAFGASAQETHPQIHAFSLGDVDITVSQTDFTRNQALNHEYLLLLDTDNLLFNFRTTAGLSNPVSAFSYGGWEGPTVEVRGQFIGHYLSALSFAYKSTNNATFKQRGEILVNGLQECQAAFGDGYLSAFPKSHFDRLENLEPVWAPYYVIHKIMQGLLDQHRLVDNPNALPMVLEMADYFCARSGRVQEDKGSEYWGKILETEFGGMNDVLYQLAMVVEDGNRKKDELLRCARFFDKPAFFKPLVDNKDTFNNLHANTHLAQVNGFIARYEASGRSDNQALSAVENFFSILTNSHSFSTGGSNFYEHWGVGKQLGDAISDSGAAANTQESCTTYNALKIARALFQWSGSPEYVDFYERGLLNGVLGVQRVVGDTHEHNHHVHMHNHGRDPGSGNHLHLDTNPVRYSLEAINATNTLHEIYTRPSNHHVVSWPDDPAIAREDDTISVTHTAGQYIYYMPLGHESSKGDNPLAWTKGWGDAFNTFWCCYGTAVESFSKLADSIWFYGDGAKAEKAGGLEVYSSEAPILYLNQFASSRLYWREMGVTVTQEADLYSDVDNVARIRVGVSIIPPSNSIVSQGARFSLYLRIPSWVDKERFSEESFNAKSRNLITIKRNGELLPPSSLKFASSLVPETLQNPPDFGNGADYVILGPDWDDGDTIEADLPMAVYVEDLNDQRTGLQQLKAVVLGPFVMAGLTEDGDFDIDLDADEVKQALILPSEAGLMGYSRAKIAAEGSNEGSLPKGARVLKGRTKEYVVAPIGQLMDERYTAYFNFTGGVQPDEALVSPV